LALFFFRSHPGLLGFECGFLLSEEGLLFVAGLFSRHPPPLFLGGQALGFGQLGQTSLFLFCQDFSSLLLFRGHSGLFGF
jgi:hypothetical protein